MGDWSISITLSIRIQPGNRSRGAAPGSSHLALDRRALRQRACTECRSPASICPNCRSRPSPPSACPAGTRRLMSFRLCSRGPANHQRDCCRCPYACAQPAPAISLFARSGTCPVSDSRHSRQICRGVPCRHQFAAQPPGARTEVNHIVGVLNRLLRRALPPAPCCPGHAAGSSVPISRSLSRACRPMEGSSRTYSTPRSFDPICVASRMRCASPPDSVAAERSTGSGSPAPRRARNSSRLQNLLHQTAANLACSRSLSFQHLPINVLSARGHRHALGELGRCSRPSRARPGSTRFSRRPLHSGHTAGRHVLHQPVAIAVGNRRRRSPATHLENAARNRAPPSSSDGARLFRKLLEGLLQMSMLEASDAASVQHIGSCSWRTGARSEPAIQQRLALDPQSPWPDRRLQRCCPEPVARPRRRRTGY